MSSDQMFAEEVAVKQRLRCVSDISTARILPLDWAFENLGDSEVQKERVFETPESPEF